MRERLRVEAAWHIGTARRLLGMTPPWVVTVPVLGALAVYGLSTIPAVAPCLDKATAEFLSPVILAAALAAAAWLTRRPHPYYRWQALFALALLLRELHFEGTNTGFYIALVLLLGWASAARDRLEPFFSDRRVVTLFMAMLWTYAVSKTLDRHYWDPLLRPAGLTNDLFEENLEILGHLLFLALVAVSMLVDLPPPVPRG